MITKTRVLLAAGAVLAQFTVCASNTWGATPPGAAQNKAVPGWYLGMPIVLNARTPPSYGGDGPSAPSPRIPDLTVYLSAPINNDVPHGPERLVKTPRGEMFLPAHIDTVVCVASKSQPRDARGVFVVQGPKGTDANVRVRAMPIADPKRSFPGAPLVQEIRLGPAWVPLNNHLVIEYGVSLGLLKLVPFEYGGLMWITSFETVDFPHSARCADAKGRG